jgi:hypothetical protein
MKTFDKPFGPFVLKIKTEITQTATFIHSDQGQQKLINVKKRSKYW